MRFAVAFTSTSWPPSLTRMATRLTLISGESVQVGSIAKTLNLAHELNFALVGHHGFEGECTTLL